jgi:hypothetical protein
LTYYPDNLDPTDTSDIANLDARRQPYLDKTAANVFKVGMSGSGVTDGLFEDPTPLEPDTFVLCDVFGIKTVTVGGGKTAKAGTPILYYKANPANKGLTDPVPQKRVYNVRDNMPFTAMLTSIKSGEDHPLGEATGTYQAFYDFITDPTITSMKQPYKADSYILISAGADGLYGTKDDITNF